MTTPYQHQIEDVEQIHKFNGICLLANEPGTGKSFTSLLFAQQKPAARPIIVVCPASIKWNWQREFNIHIGMYADVLEGKKPPERKPLTSPEAFIINYDILYKWIDYLKGLNPQIVIIDECVYVKSPKALRTKTVRQLCRGVPYVLALGGTGGMNNRPAELWPTLNILRPDLFPNFWPYGMRYCAPRRNRFSGGWDFLGASNLPELHKILTKNLMIRRKKSDVLKNLPPKMRMVLPLEIEDKKEYKSASQNFIRWIVENHGMAKAAKISKAEQITKLTFLKHLAAQLKLPSVIDWVDNFLYDTEEKLILFAIHHDIIDRLHQEYKQQSVVITGETVGKKRQDAFDQFINDPRTRLLIGNIQAAGVGWSGKGVSTVAFAELDWTPGAHIQAEDRIHGIGRGSEYQHSKFYYLISKDTIETKLVEIIEQKQAILNRILDGKVIEGELDVYDLLTQAIMEQEK